MWWPFRTQHKKPDPEDVVLGNNRAWFLDGVWYFEVEQLTFSLSGTEFDPQAFEWATECICEIRRLWPEIDHKIVESLGGWADPNLHELYNVCLDDYAQRSEICLTFFGDETWGDLGVDIVIANGLIVRAEAYN